MSTIDTKKIENFDKMTDSEKVAALTAFEFQDATEGGKLVSKALFDKTSSEVASLKKLNAELRSKLTEEDAAKIDRAEKEAADKAERDKLSADLEAARKELAKMAYLNNYISMGFEKNLAEETAAAMAVGDMAKVLENTKRHIETQKSAIKAELMNSDPKPGYGGNVTNAEDSDVALGKEVAARVYGGAEAYQKTLDYYS